MHAVQMVQAGSYRCTRSSTDARGWPGIVISAAIVNADLPLAGTDEDSGGRGLCELESDLFLFGRCL